MRRKPDIKYTKREEDLESLQTIQLAILDNAVKVLKEDGRLVYSTCTVDRRENEGTVQAFLAAHPEMESVRLENLPTELVRNNKMECYKYSLKILVATDFSLPLS